MYAKVFTQIFDSSIADDFRLRHFFMDLLVLADADGCVDMTPSAIAARTRIPLEEVTAMLAKLEAPDPESRTPDADGRRIERLDDHRTWGWHIINYDRFRRIASDEQRKASQRERFRRWKGRHLESANASLTGANASLTLTNAPNAMQKQKQRQKEGEPPAPCKLAAVDRIGLEKKLVILKGRREALRDETADRWQREENPQAVEALQQVEAQIREAEEALLCQ